MATEKSWIFVPNLNATEDGLNDAGIETFSAESVKSMTREVIQNSIDQRTPGSVEPVVVKFDDFEISKSQFPNGNQFEDILGKCIENNKSDTMVVNFFKQAKDLMNKSIKVMRISDFNTTGLIGAETGEKGTPWHGLIKAKGSSNKNITSGGSFGIGKSAPFACSNLRTVIYASKTDDVYSYIGVSRLTSFKNDGQTTIGTGYYSDNVKLKAILKQFSYNGFIRSENGTDIYIMGFNEEENLKKTIKEAVLSNFFVSIWKGLLTIQYKDLIINKDNLGHHIASLDDKEFFDLKQYYKLLISEPIEENPDIKKIKLNSKEFGEKFDIKDGECELLLMRSEDLNKRILMTRQPGMSLFQQAYINGSISFTGILLISGDTMNEIFKNMEMPAHDAWEPTRCKVNQQKYIKAYKELRKYLKDKVMECFGQTQDLAFPAYGMEEFFSDIENSDGEIAISVLEGKVRTKVKRITTKKKKKNKTVAKDGINVNGPEDIPQIPPDDPTTPVPPKQPNPSTKQPKETKFKYVDLKKWLLCKDSRNGEYTLKFGVDKKRKHIKLEFLGIAEKGNYNLKLKNARVSGQNIGPVKIENNIIVIDNIPAKNNIVIDFAIEFNKKCMMDVNYYEA